MLWDERQSIEFERIPFGIDLLELDRLFLVLREYSWGNKPHDFEYDLREERTRCSMRKKQRKFTSDFVNEKSFPTIENFNKRIILLVSFIVNRFITFFILLNTWEKICNRFFLRYTCIIWTFQFHFLNEECFAENLSLSLSRSINILWYLLRWFLMNHKWIQRKKLENKIFEYNIHG